MSETLHIVTCSYGPDFERCRRLCASIDRFVPDRIRHSLIVPRRDLERFTCLTNQRREVHATEAVVPGGLRQFRLGHRWWRDQRGWPIRGWIVQQLAKLSADRVTESEYLLFADSDLQFIRPFDEGAVIRDGRLRLHRIPGAKRDGVHGVWHRRAGALLGSERGYAGADYVGQLITWRRSHLRGLKKQIEASTERPWHRAVGRSLRVSEYILYGVYVDRIVAAADRGHYDCQEDLCHCCWFAEEAQALERGEARIDRRAVALLLQSNLGFGAGRESAITRLASQQLEST
jgi:hypothetical protein